MDVQIRQPILEASGHLYPVLLTFPSGASVTLHTLVECEVPGDEHHSKIATKIATLLRQMAYHIEKNI